MSAGSAWDATAGDGARKESELQGFVGLLRRRKFIVAAAIIVAVIGASALVSITKPVYQGRALIQAESSAAQGGTAADQRQASIGIANTEAKILTDAGFLTSAAKALHTTYGELAGSVSASAIDNTELIRVTTTAPSAAEAQALAQRFATYAVQRAAAGYEQAVNDQVKALRDQRDVLQTSRTKLQAQQRKAQTAGDSGGAAGLGAEISDLDGQIAQLDVQISETIASGPLQSASISLVSPATASDTQISPRPIRSIALGALLGIVLGIAFAWLRDQFDRRVRTLVEVDAISGGQVLGSIPVIRSPDARSLAALENAFDFVRVNISMATRDGRSYAAGITSATEGEGKTFVALEFARALARAGRTVVVVDGDLRRRTLSLRTDTDREPGLGDFLVGHVDAESVIFQCGSVSVVPAGPPIDNPSPMLDSRMFEELMRALRRMFDFVVIDTPPAGHIADASIIARQVDGMMLVTRLGIVERASLRSTIALFRQEPYNLLGVIVQSDEETLKSDYHYVPPRTKFLGRPSRRERAASKIAKSQRSDA